MLKPTFASTLDSNMPDITSLNLLDQDSALKNKPHAPSSPKGNMKKVCPQSLKKLSTVPLVKNTVRMEREKTPPGFPDSVYTQAAAIFQKTHVEKDHVHRIIRYGPSGVDDASGIIGDVNIKRNEHWAYDLAFNTLKYLDLLEDILIDSLFYRSQQMPDDLMALVVVLLYDLMERKFQPREPLIRGEGLIKEVRQVEDRLRRYKTKLEASLAHCRIKQNLLTIDNFLPLVVREKQQRRRTIPLYAWVNTLKASIENVCEILKTTGFTQVASERQLAGSVFCKDTHCSNVLLFPRSVQKQLEKIKLVTEHTLIIQDKSRSLVACAVRPLLTEKCDVLMVGSFSAHTVAHVAVQAAACSACLHVCGVIDPIIQEELQTTFSSIGCTNIKLLSDDFNELNEWDSRIQKVRVIVVLPQCSASALCNPVEFLLNESGDRGLIHGLSKGTISDSKLEALVAKQTQYLSHALTFSKVKAVVYCTCSVHPEENEQLVKGALEKADGKPKALPLSAGWGDEGETFFKIEASDLTNGCFLCVMKREQDPAEVETVQDVLARAAAKGLLGGFMSLDPLSGEKPKKRKKQKGPPLASTQNEPSTSVETNLNPDYTQLVTTVSQTATIQSTTNLDQISLVMDGTSNKHFNVPRQASDDPTPSSIVQKKQTKRHRPCTKAPKQSRRKNTSKPLTRKEHQSRTQPTSKKLLELRTSQQTSTNGSALRNPPTLHASKHLHSRTASQQDSLSSQEVLNSKHVIKSKLNRLEREFSLPPVFQQSPAHLSSSLHRLLSSTSSNFSSSISSSSSIEKDSMVSHSQIWR
ncbi:putative methyltransferase NSUN7 [Triplophysa dalaica]|uniref:putative methyltransferase NSUN7 n=1 Tax=Triplophysa dalaica TaxID=1582913 RepID=UPI0024DFEB76|nr:putative methyltransferase NSUN7 [Triplophysa dalaica]